MTASSTELRRPATTVYRERTAIRRRGLSLPAQQSLLDGLLTGRRVLDYGCGRGGDVRGLTAAGIDTTGWDPHYRPHPPPRAADVVLCSYVLNVIDDPAERAATLRRAFELAHQLLVIGVRTTHDARHVRGIQHGDGTLTTRQTFHHLFSPAELRTWAHEQLNAPVIPLQPGLAYVFRHTRDRACYLSTRYGGSVSPDEAGDVLDRLVTFWHGHGRGPAVEEAPDLCAASRTAYGNLATAIRLARREADPATVARAATRRRRDLLVVLALERFHGGFRISDLPPTLAADARSAYPRFRDAVREADRLLWATGNPDHIRTAVRASHIGKTSPTALYVHVDAEPRLSALLRVYAACGAMIAGRPPDTTLLKLHHDRPAVSFLLYPSFDRDPHPRLGWSLTIDLPRLRGTWNDFTGHTNRPLLHRKEEFLHPSDPRYERFRRLTRSEERAGLYEHPELIGRESGWEQLVRSLGLAFRGHRLVRQES